MATDLTKAKRKRTTRRNIVLKQMVPACEIILESEKNEESLEDAKILLEEIREAAVEMKGLDEKVSDLTEDDDEFEKIEDESYKMGLTLKKIGAKLVSFLEGKPDKTDVKPENKVNNESPNVSTQKTNVGVKLPKITIQTYDGDAMNWNAFIESFNATIHKREDLSAIEKFTYLRGFLKGDALQTIQGMPLTQENYDEAKDMLEKRYGNPQLIVSSHMNALLKLEKVISANGKDLRELYNKIEINTRALSSSGVSTEHFGALLIPIVLEKLPDNVRLQISRNLGSDNWEIKDFMAAINDEVTARENFEYLKKKGVEDDVVTDKPKVGSIASLAVQQKKSVCVFCESSSHYSDRCDVITDISLRKQKLKDKRCCFRCMKSNHTANICRTRVFCFRCKKTNKHNTAICDAVIPGANQNVARSDRSVILQSACAYITDEKETKLEEIEVLLDNCSQQTFVTERMVKKLGLKPKGEVCRKINAFGSEKETVKKLKEYTFILKPMDKSGSIKVTALAMTNICAPIVKKLGESAVAQNEFLKNLKLADNRSNSSGNIDVLIGADVYWEIVSGNLKRNPDTGLVAISSSLGWLINGPVENATSSSNMVVSSSHVLLVQDEKSEKEVLSDEVRKFWRLDLLGIGDDEEAEDADIEDLGKVTFKHGRYHVELPFLKNHHFLPDNFSLCEKRLKKLKEKLDVDADLKKKYNNIMMEQLNLGIIEQIVDPGEAGNVTYLPHREVIREDKTSTKVRIVFDGSARRRNNVSLNQVLHKGPALNPHLLELLLKFRIHRIGITADLEKAYLQVGVEEHHRDYLRFLWYDDVFSADPKIVTYRFTRVPFGITPSQYLLNASVRKHGERYEKIDPEFSRKVKENFYVDDLNTGVKDVNEGLDVYKKMKIRFNEAQFNVRKWRSNSKELIRLMDPEDVSQDVGAKVLGIRWNEDEDYLIMGVKEVSELAKDLKPTKRNVMKVIASIYDPVGFLAPVLVDLKLLFQDICLTDVDWDSQLEERLVSRWMKIVKKMSELDEIYINRCYFTLDEDDPISRIEIHGYSDAASKIFGACIYLRAISRSGRISTSFITAKSRIKPIRKEFTMPKMELLGNLILSQLMKSVMEILSKEMKIDDYFCWTDSMVTLSWIKSTDKTFKVFVENRVKQIRENTDCEKWGYCNTKENPADCITRADSSSLLDSSLWREGPKGLKLSDLVVDVRGGNVLNGMSNQVSNGDSQINPANNDETNYVMENKLVEEMNQVDNEAFIKELSNAHKKVISESNNNVTSPLLISDDLVDNGMSTSNEVNCLHQVVCKVKNPEHNLLNIERYSSVRKLVNVTAWIYRFILNSRRKSDERIVDDVLTVDEKRMALRFWIKINQNILVNDVKYEQIKCSLNLLRDGEGVIRAHGRLQLAKIPEEALKPIMLDRSHRLAELILWDCHNRVKHNGVRETLNEFQTQYWVTRSRSFGRKILSRCVLCRFLNSRQYSYPKSPVLPETRLKDDRAFAVTGMDHFGIIHCKNVFKENTLDENDMHPCHVLIYTCASTRGIILDLVPDTSSKEVVNSLKRFIARRGCPQEVLSDPGSAFTAKETKRFATDRNVRWKYSLAKAPWFGAIWERLIQSVKRCLKRTVGQAKLTVMEMQTVLLEIENILNSRPLCELYDDLVSPLTPNHLLFGRNLNQSNKSGELEVNFEIGRKRVQYIETVVEHFWNRWRQEYLNTLRNWQSKYKRRNSMVPEVGDVVLIYEEKSPRHRWPLGRIIEKITSGDGQVRGAKVFVGKTKVVIERAINQLYPIERINEFESNDNQIYDNTVEEISNCEATDYKQKLRKRKDKN